MNNPELNPAVQSEVAKSNEYIAGLDIGKQNLQDAITRAESIGHAVFNEKYYTVSYLRNLVEKIDQDREEELESISPWTRLVEPIREHEMPHFEFSLLKDIVAPALKKVLIRK